MAAPCRPWLDCGAAERYPLGGMSPCTALLARMSTATRQRFASLGLGFASWACSNPTLPTHELELELQADTVWISRSPNEVRITVPVTVRNTDARPLYVSPCGHVLQVANDARWTVVWSSPCTAGRLFSLELSPGESTLLTLETRVPIGSDVWPATAVGGTYRAILALTVVPLNIGGVTPTPVAPEARTTEPFPVRIRTVVF